MLTNPEADHCRHIFGYGSLMWRPDFEFVKSHLARVAGYHRRLSVISKHYRGTEEKPGLVFGLDRGGSVLGVAYEVADAQWPKVLDYVRKRELITAIYREIAKPVTLVETGQVVLAVTYVVDPHHEQYAAPQSVEATAAIVAQAIGIAGSCAEYVTNTAQHLRALGIHDKKLEALMPYLNGLSRTHP